MFTVHQVLKWSFCDYLQVAEPLIFIKYSLEDGCVAKNELLDRSGPPLEWTDLIAAINLWTRPFPLHSGYFECVSRFFCPLYSVIIGIDIGNHLIVVFENWNRFWYKWESFRLWRISNWRGNWKRIIKISCVHISRTRRVEMFIQVI